MFKIVMITPDGNTFNTPGDKDLGFVSACDRASAYKKREPDRRFCVVNAESGDVEYEA